MLLLGIMINISIHNLNNAFTNAWHTAWEWLVNNTVRSDWLTPTVRYTIMIACFLMCLRLLYKAISKDLKPKGEGKDDFKNITKLKKGNLLSYIMSAILIFIIIFLQIY